MLLSRFGDFAGTVDVLARAERNVVFDLGAVATDGRLPDQISVDLAAAPSINGEAPIASIYINDFLLGAQKLVADGSAQRLTVAVPRYVLAARNEVRVAFLRQPTQVRCHDTPMAYPVSILPGSHLHLAKVDGANDFIGLAGQYATSGSLLVPNAWLAQPASTLPLVIRMADAAGLAPAATSLQLVAAGQNGKPSAAFLALDVAIDGYQPGAAARNGRLVLQHNGADALLDITGVDHLATAEVVKLAGQNGIVYRDVGPTAPTLERPFRLGRGNLAVLNDAGPALQMDMDDPNGARVAEADNPQSLWQRHMSWWIALTLAILLILLVARVVHVKRRRGRNNGMPKH